MLRQSRAGTREAALLIAAAGVCWLVTVDRMRGMDMGPGTDLGRFGWFAGVWVTMMAAMMLPSLVPMTTAYASGASAGVEAATPRSSIGTVLFAAGYLVPWAVAGAAAWVLLEGIRSVDLVPLGWDERGRYVAGAVIAAAALYELTPLKTIFLRHCRDRRFLIDGWRSGWTGAVRMGITHGSFCVGCCWALMAALFALGVMSIPWMVVIAALIAIEKLLPWRALATGTSVAVLVVLAVGVAAFPAQLPGLTTPM